MSPLNLPQPGSSRRLADLQLGELQLKQHLLSIATLVLASVAAPVVASAAPVPAAETAALSSRLANLTNGPSRRVLDAAMAAYVRASERGTVVRTNLLTVIDYSRPSTEPRLWVLDLAAGRVLYRELVAHGRRSGDNISRFFSNSEGSLMSSLGLFVTDTPYIGHNGYSLRLRGLDPGLNDHAYDRAIVLHGAEYVSAAVAAKLGRLGRSWGCPAVRAPIAHALIDTIKGGSVLFAYGGSDTKS
jgi:L,D-transpeptidase catalytic domain